MGGDYNPPNLNYYAYTHNNLVNLVDPDGLAIEFKASSTIGIVSHKRDKTYLIL